MILRGRLLQMPACSEETPGEIEKIIPALDARDGAEARRLAVYPCHQAALTVMLSYKVA